MCRILSSLPHSIVNKLRNKIKLCVILTHNSNCCSVAVLLKFGDSASGVGPKYAKDDRV